MDLITQIQKYSENHYEKEDYNYHIIPVVNNALFLAEKLNTNPQYNGKIDLMVVKVAAYLHDIGRVVTREKFQSENDHHVVGEKQAIKILTEFTCNPEFTKKVAHCVLSHRGRKGPNPETIEAEIIANADAMAHFDTFLDLFTFFLKDNNFETVIDRIEKKIQRDWDKKLTIPEAKQIVNNKYNAIMLLINSIKKYL